MKFITIDIGNSFVKAQGYIYQGDGKICREDSPPLVCRDLSGLNISPACYDMVFWSSVRHSIQGQEILEHFRDFSVDRIVDVKSIADQCCELSFLNQRDMGIDRKLSCIGARYNYREPILLVITAGTANTINIVLQKEVINSYVMTGFKHAADTLRKDTGIKVFLDNVLNTKDVGYVLQPRALIDSTASGIVISFLAAIKYIYDKMRERDDTLCVVTGGNGRFVTDSIGSLDNTIKAVYHHNIANDGLALVVRNYLKENKRDIKRAV